MRNNGAAIAWQNVLLVIPGSFALGLFFFALHLNILWVFAGMNIFISKSARLTLLLFFCLFNALGSKDPEG